MRFTYDTEADALAVELVPDAKSARTVELGAGAYADYDRRGRLIALEVLMASTVYPAKELKKLQSPVDYLTLAEASEEAGLAHDTLRKQIHNERIPGVKRGRDWYIARHDLLNYLETKDPRGRPSPRVASQPLAGRRMASKRVRRADVHKRIPQS